MWARLPQLRAALSPCYVTVRQHSDISGNIMSLTFPVKAFLRAIKKSSAQLFSQALSTELSNLLHEKPDTMNTRQVGDRRAMLIQATAG